MAKKSVLKTALTDEVKRTILRESLTRYRNELLGDEKRQLLQDCIRRLRRALGIMVG